MKNLPHDTKTPDIETSSESYRSRFAGEAGKYFIEKQNLTVRKALSKTSDIENVSDVGGGHCQITSVLLENNRELTIQGSTEVCFNFPEQEFKERFKKIESSIFKIPLMDKTFDLVASIRTLPHVENIEEFIQELTRLSKKYVLVDFPIKKGLNKLTPLLFGFKKKIEGNTRPYFSYEIGEIKAKFQKNGFKLKSIEGQFIIPMGLHRALKSYQFSKKSENCLAKLGLCSSPVIALFERE